MLHIARSIVGAEAFSIGFNYGLISHPLHEVTEVGDLVRIFVLAEVHEYFFAMSSPTRSLAPMGPGSLLARKWLMAFNRPSSFRHRTEQAYRQREELLAEINALMADPVAFFAGMPGRMKDGYSAKWRRAQALREQPDPGSQFEAGTIAGELTMEILLLLAGLVTAGAAAMKIAGKVPRLLEWARALRTPKGASPGAGSSAAALESTASRAAPKATPRKVASQPVVEGPAANKPAAQPLSRGERLQIYYQRLREAPPPKNADEALGQVRNALDAVEDEHR